MATRVWHRPLLLRDVPELTLASGITYHLFLSHVWSTGQDQVAIIKRRLTVLVPNSRIFLGESPVGAKDRLSRSDATERAQARD